ncbi:MAG TPA: RecQ family ATP-dependent DNA helicase [Rectinemataceae bacterium]|nr:RecQ family ATP-dependent DNA helicase [Rectinemataceae bacterium]
MDALENDITLPRDDAVAELARRQFGIDYLFPLQRMAIANILDAMETGEQTRQLVLFPTGFGKSLCFQLPALLAPGPSVVVYPLLALMNDQEKSLEKRGIPCAVFRGGMEDEDRAAQCEAVRSGLAKIVITNPECLATPRLREFLAGANIFHLAIDEAHCVSEWGETFRPSYLKLGECIEAIHPKVVSAFTATASPTVADAVARHIFGAQAFSLVTADIDKPNIRYSVEATLSPQHSLLRLIRDKPKPLIVFDQSRDGVRRICETIRERTDIDARFYHAGLAREEKNEVEAWFMGSADGVLTATCAYGMGVDKRNIRTVIHYSEPPSVEAYIQESGRGGRDGQTAEAILIHAVNSRRRREEGAVKSESERLRQERREAFLEYARSRGCRREFLHKLMGSELSSPCSGCDSCDGTARSTPEGLGEVLEFFRINGGRFTLKQGMRLLRQPPIEGLGREESGSAGAVGAKDGDDGGALFGKKSPIMRSFTTSPPTCAGAGALSGWEEREILALLREALSMGILRMGSGPLGKNKLYPARCGKAAGLWEVTRLGARALSNRGALGMTK